MKTAILILNPAAGNARLLHAQKPAVTALLAQHGYSAEIVETSAEEGSAQRLAEEARKTAALVLACGGDGTIHEVVQALAQSDVALGILPLGTANALARNLKLPLNPLAAVARLMTYVPATVPLGIVEGPRGTRWFCLMAGCGPAGTLAHTLERGSKLKARFGRNAYYLHAAGLFLTRRWPHFRVRYRTSVGNEWHKTNAIAMMASWVPDLGGLFSGVTHKASVMDQRMHVQLVRSPAWLSLPAWMLFGIHNPWVQEIEPVELRCEPLDGRPIYAQADAEPMGTLPITLRIVPDALTLLMPPVR